MNHLETYWDVQQLEKNKGFALLVAGAVDAVIDDIREAYTIAMQGANIPIRTIAEIIETVDDAISNNYDYLPTKED